MGSSLYPATGMKLHSQITTKICLGCRCPMQTARQRTRFQKSLAFVEFLPWSCSSLTVRCSPRMDELEYRKMPIVPSSQRGDQLSVTPLFVQQTPCAGCAVRQRGGI